MKKQKDYGLRAWFKNALKSGVVYYTTDHVSRTGMGGAYSFYAIVPTKIYPGNDTGKEQVPGHRLERAWPAGPDGSFDQKLASQLGFRITKTWRSFYRGGCGYNRPLDALLDIARECGMLDSSEVQRRIKLDCLTGD